MWPRYRGCWPPGWAGGAEPSTDLLPSLLSQLLEKMERQLEAEEALEPAEGEPKKGSARKARPFCRHALLLAELTTV